jgi:hypothetical protein
VSVIEEALRLVHGDRQESYGHPTEDFARTGRMWGAILGIPDVTPRLVALCLIALKVSRETHRHKDDTLVDIAGYAETLALIEERQNVTVPTVTSSETLGDLVRTEHGPECYGEHRNVPVRSPSSSRAVASKQELASRAREGFCRVILDDEHVCVLPVLHPGGHKWV